MYILYNDTHGTVCLCAMYGMYLWPMPMASVAADCCIHECTPTIIQQRRQNLVTTMAGD